MLGSDGSWVLSEQLAMYRTLDTRNKVRADNSLALNDAAWRNQYNDLVNRYNRLLQDANRLANIQDRTLAARDGDVAELKATNAKLGAQVKRLTVELADARASEKFLRGTIRELRPDTYRSVYDDE